MRILFFSTAYPQPQDPHRAPYNRRRCEALGRMHEVSVVSPRSWLDRIKSGPTATMSGSTPTSAQVVVNHPTFYYPPRLLRGAHAQFMWWSCRRFVADLVRKERPDIVLSYWTFPDSEVAIRIARRAKVPAVAMVGGSDVLLADSPAVRDRIAKVLCAADAVITVSSDLKRRITALGVDAAAVHVIPPAVDTATFYPGDRTAARSRLGLPTGERMALWVGRLVPVKAVDALLAAWRRLQDEGVNITLFMVGDGPLTAHVARRIVELQLTGRVRLAGQVAPVALADWYRAADMTLLPSISEGTPNVLLESIACGTPFVASNVGGIPALATPDIDVLVRPADAAELALGVKTLLQRDVDAPLPRQLVPVSWREAATAMTAVMADAVAKSAWRASHPATPEPQLSEVYIRR